MSRFNAFGSDHLPNDVVMQLMHQLDPLDIVSMRMTCRTMNIASHARIVWICALSRLCEMQGIMEDTFPIDDMSDRELEHAATAPYKFLGLFGDKREGYDLRPASMWTLGFPGPSSIAEVFLVPGGRFLFLQENQMISLWDLGYCANSLVEKLSEMMGGYLRAIGPNQTVGGIMLAVAQTSSTGNPQDESLYIYHIDPIQGTAAQFKKEGELEVDWPRNMIDSVHIDGDTVIIGGGLDTLVVWNWVESKGCKWFSGGYRCATSKMMVLGDTIVAHNGYPGLFAISIPPMKEISGSVLSMASFPIVPNESIAVIALEDPMSGSTHGDLWNDCEVTITSEPASWRTSKGQFRSTAEMLQYLCVLPMGTSGPNP
ncbi:hypothetical protein D9611_012753 [Ephemerocybe angulata]|uniref:F-box domain-containing protein n=1 Tax=Ephemerocybe angulata TaxID=980116 RepID=A0A8H5FJ26_9AGAR|nr:hypothetical protein D9611_012753 [Tulosesus angulatus]